MFRLSMRHAGAALALSCLACLPVGQAAAHWDNAYYHDYDDLPLQSRWMATLDDKTPLSMITLPGTHGSAARHGGWIVENQTLTIPQQLNAGIRFLDLRTRHYRNNLYLHHGAFYQHQKLDDALNAVVRFLRENPTETVLVRVKDDEHTAAGNTRSFRETIYNYYFNYKHHFAIGAKENAPLGSLRGKMVMLRNYTVTGRDPFEGIGFREHLERQDAFHLGTNWDLYGKWEKVKAHINHANHFNTNGQAVTPFINFLSGSGGAFPYFVASGHSDPRTGAPALVTGKATPFFNDWPDFPRGACLLWFCTIYFEGTNTLTKHYLNNNAHIQYAGIVAADFPGSGLIHSVVQVNRTNRMMVSANNGQCLDIEGGVRNGGNLITWPCHGGANQRFTFRHGRILVGGLCLQVEGFPFVRQGAHVRARPCSPYVEQQWGVANDGTIRSMVSGAHRCLDLIVEDRNRVGLWGCHAPSPDQQFRTRVR